MKRTVLLLNGSQRQGGGTSAVLGKLLLTYLCAGGFRSERIELRHAVKTARGIAAVCRAVEQAELIVLSFPLYLDTVPYCVTRVFEAVYKAQGTKPAARQGLVAIVNCGFPEAHHNDVALEVCRRFASASGMRWLGGLAMGGGEALKGRHPRWFLPLTCPILQALRRAAVDLAAGRLVSEQARRRMARPLLPRRLFYLMAGFRWYSAAFRSGAHQNLRARCKPSGRA